MEKFQPQLSELQKHTQKLSKNEQAWVLPIRALTLILQKLFLIQKFTMSGQKAIFIRIKPSIGTTNGLVPKILHLIKLMLRLYCKRVAKNGILLG